MRSCTRWTALFSITVVALLFAPINGQSSELPDNKLSEISANDNRSPAGELLNSVFTIDLEARTGLWYPEEKDGPGLTVHAFAERGKRLLIPGPIIRVPESTEIHMRIHNGLAGDTLTIHGLHTRPGNPLDVIQIAPGKTSEIHFQAGAPGSYFYWATTTGVGFANRFGADSQLSGAFIVDPRGGKSATSDRIFVMGWWSDTPNPQELWKHRNAIVINGRSWPHTEQLTYSEGASIHWRWINATGGNHPMHLHGFYFTVDSEGDADHDTVYAEKDRRRAVTELMWVGSTMSLTWVATRPGNWLFHCHVLPHISPTLRMGSARMSAGQAEHNDPQHALHGMAGLVVGIHILPAQPDPHNDELTLAPRKLRLAAELKPNRYGKDPGFGYSLQEGSDTERATVGIPGPPLVLTRGQPVSITVVNKLTEPTSVHWHGIELDSYYDGIAGWSGSPGHVAPLIFPGASFVAEFIPPRAGTFIYHTHVDDVRQLSSGLYGPLIVVEPGQTFNPSIDRIVLLSVQGPTADSPILLNGNAQPAPLELKSGNKYRLRFINITPHDPLLAVSLLLPGGPVSWRAIAKDGADLPLVQATTRPASQVISVGETYDFDFEPMSSGDYTLEVFRPARTTIPEARMLVAVIVR